MKKWVGVLQNKAGERYIDIEREGREKHWKEYSPTRSSMRRITYLIHNHRSAITMNGLDLYPYLAIWFWYQEQ